MGRNSQARRAAKVGRRKARQEERGASFGVHSPAGGALPPTPTPPPRPWFEGIVDDVRSALDRLDSPRQWGAEEAVARVIRHQHVDRSRAYLLTHLTDLLRAGVGEAWVRGWQPADVHRSIGRELDGPAQAVVVDAMSDQLSAYAPSTVSPRWVAQLSEVGAGVWWTRDQQPLAVRGAREAKGLAGVVDAALRILVVLGRLPTIQRLDPLPGEAQSPASAPRPDVDERILSRVRAMLAKAESTPYEAEADTFTAAAQSLMARHSIDAAMLAARDDRAKRSSGVVGRRVGIDRPYEQPKVALLGVVAQANRCRTVWTSNLGFVTVLGHGPDLDATDAIFTSLLVQATGAMMRAGAGQVRERTRTRSFRASFLNGFAHRIGQRLHEATRSATEEAIANERAGDEVRGAAGRPRRSAGVMVVLDRRAAEVDAAVEEMFPEMTTKIMGGGTNLQGWTAGTFAADQASLFDPDSVLDPAR